MHKIIFVIILVILIYIYFCYTRNKKKIIIIPNSNQSFTLDKKYIHLCPYHDKNIENYVLLHELAHTMTDDIGHTKKFNEILENLLDKASKNNSIDIKNITKTKIDSYCKKCKCN